MTDVGQKARFEDRLQQVRDAVANQLRPETDWVSFYREVLGIKGVIDQLFPTFMERCHFERTEEYAEIQQMLAKLREKSKPPKENGEEPTRVITVRLPQSLHEALRNEAHNHKTSMNKLCISKLLQVIDEELVPSDVERREPGRVPRPHPLPRVAEETTHVLDGETPREFVAPAPAPSPHEVPPPSIYHDSMSGGRPF
ncbi:MAG: toxin-antitoxin system HicB family antitoxin [Planctomycetes bacterium]|nr:toxin-antitoxin system HicB family antitoxin [Planctomycetota bacterium]